MIYSLLGILVISEGRLTRNLSSVWSMFLGVVMILMAFQNKGWIEVILSNNMFHNNTKKRNIGTFIAGLLSVFFLRHVQHLF